MDTQGYYLRQFRRKRRQIAMFALYARVKVTGLLRVCASYSPCMSKWLVFVWNVPTTKQTAATLTLIDNILQLINGLLDFSICCRQNEAGYEHC